MVEDIPQIVIQVFVRIWDAFIRRIGFGLLVESLVFIIELLNGIQLFSHKRIKISKLRVELHQRRIHVIDDSSLRFQVEENGAPAKTRLYVSVVILRDVLQKTRNFLGFSTTVFQYKIHAAALQGVE